MPERDEWPERIGPDTRPPIAVPEPDAYSHSEALLLRGAIGGFFISIGARIAGVPLDMDLTTKA